MFKYARRVAVNFPSARVFDTNSHLPQVLDDLLFLRRRKQGGGTRAPLDLVEVVFLELVESFSLRNMEG